MRLGPFSDRPDLDELAHQMFRQFSRMEYALKAAGRLKRPDGDAYADWVGFGAEIDQDFSELLPADDVLRDAVEYLREHPPKKQMACNGNLVWRDVAATAPNDTAVLLLYVARVRNNLFHGGKYGGQWIDPERSEELLSRCVTILERIVLLSEEVKAAFEN